MTTTADSRSGAKVAQSLTLDDLEKTYSSRGRATFHAVKGIDLHIEPGELVALLGPSGCGKTTTLRMIAGLETVSSGEILIGDRKISQLAPGKRGVGVGFESYALYPPLSVRDNLSYGLKARKVAGADELVVRPLPVVWRWRTCSTCVPAGLSSGQKQRVALARALVRNPPVLLLDEPLSHLDASARQRVRRELKMLQREFGYTTIVVTHDQVEALSLADRLAVMDGGIIQQFGTPDEVFDDPGNIFVAGVRRRAADQHVRRNCAPRERILRLSPSGSAGTLPVSTRNVAEGQSVRVGSSPPGHALWCRGLPGIGRSRCTVKLFRAPDGVRLGAGECSGNRVDGLGINADGSDTGPREVCGRRRVRGDCSS